MKKRNLLLPFLFSTFSVSTYATDYPDMAGVWKADVRIVASGAAVQTEDLAPGGSVITQVEITMTVDHQDEEVFFGTTVNLDKSTGQSQPALQVWGAIRSTGKEAIFLNNNGGRGHLWFLAQNKFEFCFANVNPQGLKTSLCGIMEKQK